MGHYITVTIFCDYKDCDETFTGPQNGRLRQKLREEGGWGCILDGKKKVDYCGRHWLALILEQEENGYTLHDGEWIETARLKEFGWHGLLDGGSSEGIAS